MKVFSFYPLVGNLVNFKVQRISNTNTHHLCRYIILDILLKCGVLFICTWAYQSLLPDKLTTPHLNRNVVCINLIYSYYILFFSRFDTAKFPQNYDIQK